MLNSLKHRGKITLAVIAGLLSGAFFPPDARKPEDYSELADAVKSKYEWDIQNHGLNGICNSRPNEGTMVYGEDQKRILLDYINGKDSDIFVIPVLSDVDHGTTSYIAGQKIRTIEGFENTILYRQIAPTFDQYCFNRDATAKGNFVRGKGIRLVDYTEIEREVSDIYRRAEQISPDTRDLDERLILKAVDSYPSKQDFVDDYIMSMAEHENGHTYFSKNPAQQDFIDDEIRALVIELSNHPNYQTLRWIISSSLFGDEITKPAASYVLDALLSELKKTDADFTINDLPDSGLDEIQKAFRDIRQTTGLAAYRSKTD